MARVRSQKLPWHRSARSSRLVAPFRVVTAAEIPRPVCRWRATFAARIVGVASEQRSDLKLVDPGNPNKSYLLIKVRGDDEIISQRMPPGNPLSAEQVEIIRAWIASGAKE